MAKQRIKHRRGCDVGCAQHQAVDQQADEQNEAQQQTR